MKRLQKTHQINKLVHHSYISNMLKLPHKQISIVNHSDWLRETLYLWISSKMWCTMVL